MKKMNVVAIILVTVVVGINIVGVYFIKLNENKKIEALKKTGSELEAEIIELRQYFPPQGAEKYGRIYFQYIPPSGNTFKNSQWLTKKQFESLKGEKRVVILYDPGKPKRSILKV